MRVDEIRHLTAVWTACVAVLLTSLAPSISRFIAAPALSQTLMARSSLKLGAARLHPPGMEHYVTVDVATSNGVGENNHGCGSYTARSRFEHYPFCFTHADTLSPPPSVFTALPVIKSASTTPPLPNLWPGRQFAWTFGQARAPPAFI